MTDLRAMTYTAGIDLGGTQIKAAGFGPDGELLHRETNPTRDGERVEDVPAWAETIGVFSSRGRCALARPLPIGLAAPGLPARDSRSIQSMPDRMDGLEGFDWGRFSSGPIASWCSTTRTRRCSARSGRALPGGAPTRCC